MNKINNIVIATDFSVGAKNAYRYSYELASMFGATLTLVHVKENLIMSTDVMLSSFFQKDDESLVNDIEQFISDEKVLLNRPIIKNEIKIQILNGNPITELVNLSLSNDVDLIVIGATGQQDFFTKIMGTTSLNIAHKSHCPVLLIPREAKWETIEHVLYASNHESITPIVLNEISDFVRKIDADIHFVNIKNFDPVFEIKQIEMDWNKLFDSIGDKLHFETHTIYGNNTVMELKKYSESKNINIIVFANKHRNFWQNIIHQSISEDMTISSRIPIMVMHSDDNK